jgi:hypothetical protein
LEKFTDDSHPLNLTETLASSGFPHVEVTKMNRDLAFECILISEVVTKRIPMLDDLRQGLVSESSLGFNVLNLASMYTEVKQLIFPPISDEVDLHQMKELVNYESNVFNPDALAAQEFMDRYMNELSERGKHLVQVQRLRGFGGQVVSALAFHL